MSPKDDLLNAYASITSYYFTHWEIPMEKCNIMRYVFKIKEVKYSWINIKCQDLYLLYVLVSQMKFIYIIL